MKLGVFQGTFNPVHRAHIRIVKFVIEKYKFDKFLVIPAFKPPHKDYDENLSIHRLNMAKIAFKNIAQVSDIEFKREDKSYTYHTICELYTKYQINDKINFVIGTDAFQNIEKWYKSEKLKELVKFIVFAREKDFSAKKFDYLKENGYDFILENLPFEDISSTELRNKIKNKENTEKYLIKEVEEYIEKYGLYKN